MKETDYFSTNLNFIEYPLWDIGYANSNYQTRIIYSKKGTFRRSSSLKPPTRLDWLFLNYLLKSIQGEKNNKGLAQLSLSHKNIITNSGICYSNETIERLRDSLNRWAHTTLKFEGNLYEKNKHVFMTFGIISNWEFVKGSKSKILITLDNKFLWWANEARYTKSFDFSVMKRISKPLNLRLYELFDSKKLFLSQGKIWENDVEMFGQKTTINYKHSSDVVFKVKRALPEVSEYLGFQVLHKVKASKTGRNIIFFRE